MSLTRWPRKITGRYLAIDLGTANTIIYSMGEGIILNEPSLVIVANNKVVAVGKKAKEMLGRTPRGYEVVRPLEDGVISDFGACEEMLKVFLQKAVKTGYVKPKMVFCVPSGVTPVQQGAVQQAAINAGGRKPIYIIEESVAAAIGSGLMINEAAGKMIVDIGGGTTEVAVLSFGSIMVSHSETTGGEKITQSIINYLIKEHRVSVGDNTAENIKINMASAWPLHTEAEADIVVRDLETGLPRKLRINTMEIREAIHEPVMEIVDAIRKVLGNEKSDPALIADLMKTGIYLAGGGAYLTGLSNLIQSETGFKAIVVNQPELVVAKGSGKSLEEIDSYRGVLYAYGSHNW